MGGTRWRKEIAQRCTPDPRAFGVRGYRKGVRKLRTHHLHSYMPMDSGSFFMSLGLAKPHPSL